MGSELPAPIGRWAALEDHPVAPELAAVVRPEPAVRAVVRAGRQRRDAHRRLPPAARRPRARRPLSRGAAPPARAALPGRDRGRQGLPRREAVRHRPRRRPRRIVAAIERTRRLRPLLQRDAVLPRRAAGRTSSIRGRARSGEVIEAERAFLHSCDLDRAKPINWKRQAALLRQLGVMGDLGMHVAARPAAARLATGHGLRRCSRTSCASGPGRTAAGPVRHVDNATLPTATPGGGFPMTLGDQADRAGRDEHVGLRALGHGRRRRVLDPQPKVAAALRRPRRPPALGAHRDRQPVRVRHHHRRRSSSSASPTRSSRCGRPSSPSARERSATASDASPRKRRLTAHEIFHAAQESGASGSAVALGDR